MPISWKYLPFRLGNWSIKIDKPGLSGAGFHYNHDFSMIPVRLNPRNRIQVKLKIVQPNDKYEQEADRVAEQVMRVADPGLSSSVDDTSLTNGNIAHSGLIQRACASCSARVHSMHQTTGRKSRWCVKRTLRLLLSISYTIF